MIRISKLLLAVCLLTMASSFAFADDIGFTGNYGVGNFTLNTNGGSGSVFTGGAPGSITIVGNNAGGSYVDTSFTTTAAYSGTISFNWSYTSSDQDGGFDFPFYIVVGGQSVLCCTDVSFGNPYGGSGTISFHVNAGDTFGWGVTSVDGIFGPGNLTISNLSSVADVPEPASLILMGTGLVGAMGTLRKRFAKA